MGTFGFPADPYATEGSWYESTLTRVQWEHEPSATASVLRRPTDLPYRAAHGAAHAAPHAPTHMQRPPCAIRVTQGDVG